MKAPTIRPARPEDRREILTVVEAAFGSAEEVELVERIWTSQGYDPDLEVIADLDGQVVGHALFSIGALDDDVPVPALAPLSVHPDHQNAGIGSALASEGIRRCQQRDYPLVVVTGHWDYYPRFGFEPALPLGIQPTNAEDLPDLRAFMVRRLGGYDGHSGVFRYCWDTNNDT